MTERLRTLMDREADRDFAAVDLDAITAAGDRTVRRRRITAGAAGVAALAVVATGAALLGGGDDEKADVVDPGFDTGVPMWTEGSVLHTPTTTHDLGRDVVAFVRTDDSIIFLGEEGEQRYGVYTYDGEGEAERIAESGSPLLIGGQGTPYAGYYDREDDQAVVIDTSTGEPVWSTLIHEDLFPWVVIDGTTAYYPDFDTPQTTTVDLVTGEERTEPERGRRLVVAARGDLLAYFVEDERGADAGIEVRRAGSQELIAADPAGQTAVFSPDGTWVAVTGDEIQVFDTATGASHDVRTDALGYEWLDGDTLMVLGEGEETDTVEVLSCEIPAGSCAVETTMRIDAGKRFAVPASMALFGLALESESSPHIVETQEAAPFETSSTERPE